MNINRVTLRNNKEFIMFIFYGFITCLIYRRGILSSPACDVHVRMKTNGTAIKIAKETTNNQ